MICNSFYDMVQMAYSMANEDLSDPSVSEAKVKNWVNEGYLKLCNMRNWKFLEKETTIDFGQDTLASDAAVSDVNLTLVANSDFVVGQDVIIYTDDDTMDVRTITGRDGTQVITVNDGLDNAHSAGAYVYAYSSFLPWDLKAVEKIYYKEDPDGNYSEAVLESLTEKDFRDEYTDFNSVADTPSNWVLGSFDYTRFPSSGTWTLDSGTSWTAIYNSVLLDEGYDGCLLINTTEKHSARIESYDHSTKTFTLEEEIDSQGNGDAVFIIRKKLKIKLYPCPKYEIPLRVIYYRQAASLGRDYDYHLLPDNFGNLPSLYAAYQILNGQDGQEKNAMDKGQAYNQGVITMKNTLEYKVDRDKQIKPVRNLFC